MKRNRSTIFGRMLALGMAIVLGAITPLSVAQTVEAATSLSQDMPSKGLSLDNKSIVMVQGDILRSDSFDGYITKYNGEDALIIKAGLNIVDVELIPVSNSKSKANGSGVIRKRLYIVGKNGTLSGNGLYLPGKLLDYYSFLAYIGATASDANYRLYLEYVKTYYEILRASGHTDIGGIGNTDTVNTGSTGNHPDKDYDDDDDDDDDDDGDDGDEKESANRLIMIYMDGADLGPCAITNLSAMIKENIGKSIGEKNHIIILTGGSDDKNIWKNDEFDISRYLYGTDGEPAPELALTLGKKNQLWELCDGGKLRLIKDGFNNDSYMTSEETLKEFITTVADMYKSAEYYDLVLWDHGGGPEGGFGMDTRNPNDRTMTLYGIANALQDSGIKFDLIAFDACLMGNAEVAISLARYADYILYSELSFPGHGLLDGYKNIISELVADNDIGTVEYAGSILDACIDSYSRLHKDATLALIDTTKVRSELAEALKYFADELYSIATTNNEPVLDAILRIRRQFAYVETQESSANCNELIDIIDFTKALMNDDRMPEDFAEACRALNTAATNSILNFASCFYDEKSIERSQGSNPNGISLFFPTINRVKGSIEPGNNNAVDQSLNLIRAYQSRDEDESLTSYGKALAAYALWLKVGSLLGDKTYWRDTPVEDDKNGTTLDSIISATGDMSVGELIEASQLDYEDAQALISSQIEDRIKKNSITVTDSDRPDAKILKIEDVDPGLVECVELRLLEDGVSLGTNNYDYSYIPDGGRDAGARTIAVTVNQYDNLWLTLAGNVVSYYDTEIKDSDDGSGKKCRYGVIPVAYWMAPRAGDETDLKLEDAINNNKVDIGLIDVVFDQKGDGYSKVGRVLGYRSVGESSMANSARAIDLGEIYELIAGLDTYNGTKGFRSIGVIQNNGDNMNEVRFDNTFLDIEYNIVDVYGSRYSLNSENFGDDNDTRNLEGFRAEPEDDRKSLQHAPSVETSPQNFENGDYELIVYKSVEPATPALAEDTASGTVESEPVIEEDDAEPSESAGDGEAEETKEGAQAQTPEEPGQPEESGQPEEPDQLEQPDQQEESEQSVEPEQSAEPEQPSESEQVEESQESGESQESEEPQDSDDSQ